MQKPDSYFQCGRYRFAINKPLVMGILNITTDSFSDGGQFFSHSKAIEHALMMKEQGADFIDIGGESSRPGAIPISIEEELKRILPIINYLYDKDIAISIDTYKPEVMKAALEAGADMINDIYAFTKEKALAIVAKSNCGICAMHMQGNPSTMQANPIYDDVVLEVNAFLNQRWVEIEAAGIARTRVIVDPGFGFGKTVENNYTLLRHLKKACPPNLPILVGLSRKSMLRAVLPKESTLELVNESIAAALFAVEQGAAIVRVHDVGATVRALTIWSAAKGKSCPDSSFPLFNSPLPLGEGLGVRGEG